MSCARLYHIIISDNISVTYLCLCFTANLLQIRVLPLNKSFPTDCVFDVAAVCETAHTLYRKAFILQIKYC